MKVRQNTLVRVVAVDERQVKLLPEPRYGDFRVSVQEKSVIRCVQCCQEHGDVLMRSAAAPTIVRLPGISQHEALNHRSRAENANEGGAVTNTNFEVRRWRGLPRHFI